MALNGSRYRILSLIVLAGLVARGEPMRTEANSPVVKEVALETGFVVCGGKAHVFALDAK